MASSSGGSGGSGGGKSSPQVVDNGGREEKLSSMLDVINQIQQIASMEKSKTASSIPEGYFGIKEQTAIWAVGFNKTFYTGLFTLLLTPFVVEVFEKNMQVLGGPPTFADKFLVLALGLGFSFVQTLLVSLVGPCYVGPYTKKMIGWFISGVRTGAIFKAVLGVTVYNLIAFFFLNPVRLQSFMLKLKTSLEPETIVTIYSHLLSLRNTFIDSSFLVMFSSLLLIVIPKIAIWKQEKANIAAQQIFVQLRK